MNQEEDRMRVCVVGAGTRFLSGISYYTLRLSNAFSSSYRVSAILMRQLLPTRFYPGRERVGARLTNQKYDPCIKVFDGVDWYWLPSIFRAIILLIRERPNLVIFQWWTGTVLHTYLLLALFARLMGAKVVIEFHEVLDSGELRLHFARKYVSALAPYLFKLANGFVIHSEFDRPFIEKQYRLQNRPVIVIPLGPFDHYKINENQEVFRAAPLSCCNLLFFGVIRPFKGLEDLLRAYETIPGDEIDRFWLTIVGETWEKWTLPSEMIAESRYRHRITFVNRYVNDEEVAAIFAGADAVVLPYHRSSASGPLHVAMSMGLPVVVTQVGGLTEAVDGYGGAILIPPHDPDALRNALFGIASLNGKSYPIEYTWQNSVARYSSLFEDLYRES